jgi:putative flavoprotein involved in K+ transport
MSESADKRLSDWLSAFGKALDAKDIEAAAGMFEENGYWRDLVSLTWNINTAEGRAAIAAMLKATVAKVKPTNWRANGKAT